LQIKMLVICLNGQLISIIVVKCYRFQSFKYMFDCSSVIIDMILCLVIFIKKMLVVISLVVNLFSFRLSVFALIKIHHKDFVFSLVLDKPMFVSPSCRLYRTKNQRTT